MSQPIRTTTDDIANRFAYHPPTTEERRQDHSALRFACLTMATYLNDNLPAGREKALAITHLEEVMFWGNAAIARQLEEVSG